MKTVFSDGLRQLTIKSALNVVSALQLVSAFPKTAGRGVIFTLHHVRPKIDRGFNPNSSLEISPEFLESAIVTAKQAGLVAVQLEDLPLLLETADPHKKFVCFTLDDGYRNNAEFAAPIFHKHNVPYTIFICPGFVRRERSMWWESLASILSLANDITFDFGHGEKHLQTRSTWQKQNAFHLFADYVNQTHEDFAVKSIEDLSRSLKIDPMAVVEREVMTEAELTKLSFDPLLRFGGHTISHCNLARADDGRLFDEIKSSCELVSKYGNRKVTSFAYPYGGKHAATVREFNVARALGVEIAVTTQPGIITNAPDQLTGMKRISLNGHYQKKRYARALASGLPYFGVS
jgi:peptidoglycan/xylan/chitin deacetylase (PgdA/CDA1 family)